VRARNVAGVRFDFLLDLLHVLLHLLYFLRQLFQLFQVGFFGQALRQVAQLGRGAPDGLKAG
jgi:hypothetical protein